MTMGRVTEGHPPPTQWRQELVGRDAYAGRYYGPSTTMIFRPTPSHEVHSSIGHGAPPMLLAIGPPPLDLLS